MSYSPACTAPSGALCTCRVMSSSDGHSSSRRRSSDWCEVCFGNVGEKMSSHNYIALATVGRGAFGRVYKSHPLGRPSEVVAVKRTLADLRYQSRERALLMELRHPCIVPLSDAFITYAPELVNGEVRRERKKGVLTPPYKRDIQVRDKKYGPINSSSDKDMLSSDKSTSIIGSSPSESANSDGQATTSGPSNAPACTQPIPPLQTGPYCTAHLHQVFPFFPITLDETGPLPPDLVRRYSFQLLRSLLFLHVRGVVHRDVKPQNILVDSNARRIFLADFGSAKKVDASAVSASYVCSRHYRAPELIFGSTSYSCAVDLWSYGCILAELISGGRKLFMGNTAIDQIIAIIRVIGAPDKDELKAMNTTYEDLDFPQVKGKGFSRIFARSNHAKTDEGLLVERLSSDDAERATDVLHAVLKFDPSKRATPAELIRMPFFATEFAAVEDWTEEERYILGLVESSSS